MDLGPKVYTKNVFLNNTIDSKRIIKHELEKRLYKDWKFNEQEQCFICEDGFKIHKDEYESGQSFVSQYYNKNSSIESNIKSSYGNSSLSPNTKSSYGNSSLSLHKNSIEQKPPEQMSNKELIENKLIDFLYIDDSFISSRIIVEDSIKVKYYKMEDIKEFVPSWWKRFFMSSWKKCELINEKNKMLWYEASAVAKAKKLCPLIPPNRYQIG